MKVERQSLRTWVVFKHIAPGVVFMGEYGDILMKMAERSDLPYNAINLETGEVCDYEGDCMIELLDAVLTY